jgi:hypothetical protein
MAPTVLVGVGRSSGTTTRRDGEKDGAAAVPTKQHLQRLENGGAARLRSSAQRSSGSRSRGGGSGELWLDEGSHVMEDRDGSCGPGTCVKERRWGTTTSEKWCRPATGTTAAGRHRRRSAAVTLTEEMTRKGLYHRSLCTCLTHAAACLTRSCRWRERAETIEPDWIRRPTGEKEGERKGEKKKRIKERKKEKKKRK